MTDTKSLPAALAQLQTRLPEIKKTETADVQTQKGSYSYTYAGLSGITSQILPLLGELGLSFVAKPTFSGDRFVLAYSLLHVSGEREDGEYPLPTSGTPQAIGSAITYGRRYCLCAVTGVAPEEDDDGATAEAEASAKRGTAQRARPAKKQSAPRNTTTAKRANSAPPPLPDEEPAGPSDAQKRKAMAMFKEQGIEDRDARLEFTSKAIGRQVASFNDLTRDEAGAVIEHLEPTGTDEQSPLPEEEGF